MYVSNLENDKRITEQINKYGVCCNRVHYSDECAYKYSDLTVKQKSVVLGMASVIDDVEDFIKNYEAEDVSKTIAAIKEELAKDALMDLYNVLLIGMHEVVISFCEGNGI